MPRSTEGHARRPHFARGEPLFEGEHGRVRRLGSGALDFTRWFFQSKYALMASFMGELEEPPDARDEADLRHRYCAALTHGVRVQRLRTLVTVLLAMGVVTAAFATALDALVLPPLLAGNLDATRILLQKVAAWSASASVLLVALRLAFDRYLGLVDVSAIFLGMQLATVKPSGASGPRASPPR